jgi:polyhydroxyalkanoate synthesis regulator phasin
MATASIKVVVSGLDAVRRQLAQADEVIDELRTQVDDLTDENNRLRAAQRLHGTA